MGTYSQLMVRNDTAMWSTGIVWDYQLNLSGDGGDGQVLYSQVFVMYIPVIMDHLVTRSNVCG